MNSIDNNSTNQSLLYLPSSVVNLVVTSEPVFTMIAAYLVLGERMNFTQMTGSAILLLAVGVLGLGKEGVGKWIVFSTASVKSTT